MPIIETECFDPEYIRLKKGQADFDLEYGLKEATQNFKGASSSLEKVYKKYGDKIFTAYSFDWNVGQEFLYPKLIITYEELVKKAGFYFKTSKLKVKNGVNTKEGTYPKKDYRSRNYLRP
ncbi:hypothetical protein ES708_24627 [subsurface metagenome]